MDIKRFDCISFLFITLPAAFKRWLFSSKREVSLLSHLVEGLCDTSYFLPLKFKSSFHWMQVSKSKNDLVPIICMKHDNKTLNRTTGRTWTLHFFPLEQAGLCICTALLIAAATVFQQSTVLAEDLLDIKVHYVFSRHQLIMPKEVAAILV